MEICHQYRMKMKYLEKAPSSHTLIPDWWKKIDLNLQNTIISTVDFHKARQFIEEYEWIGTIGLPKSIRYKFGIWFGRYLGGVVVYNEPHAFSMHNILFGDEEYKGKVVQLNRGATAFWTPKNTASYLISRTLKQLKNNGIKTVIAYCTPEAGELGTIYQSCNFIYIGDGMASTVYWLDGHWVSGITLKDKYEWLEALDDDEKREQYKEKFDSLKRKKLKPKKRYLKLLGTHKEIKDMKTKLRRMGYEDLPYINRCGGSVKGDISSCQLEGAGSIPALRTR